ncbi:profilin-1-like [Leucoraja erinacea]|uniref:profilin-1-like n=1 Tax=Leucoraja erinaceus TaxID=7782 RepID=UPI002455F374|nr:profilin-1-like [Leucoraja erinacea]
MTWAAYIEQMMSGGDSQDAAIIGYEAFSIWAAFPTGNFGNVTADQVKAIVSNDQNALAMNGLQLGIKRYTVLINNLHDDGYMIVKGKSEREDQRCNVVIGKTEKAIIMLEGNNPQVKSTLNEQVSKIVDTLKNAKM